MRRSGLSLLAVSLAVAIAAQLPANIAVAQQPTSTTATYGGWVVRCQRQKDDATVCEMVQTLAANKGQVVAQVAIGQLPKAKAPRAALQVPIGVDLTKAPSLAIGEKAQYSGRYVTCTQRFCRAEIDLPANVVDEVSKAKKASVNFSLLNNKNVVVTMQTEGMATALDKALKGGR